MFPSSETRKNKWHKRFMLLHIREMLKYIQIWLHTIALLLRLVELAFSVSKGLESPEEILARISQVNEREMRNSLVKMQIFDFSFNPPKIRRFDWWDWEI